uniref:UDENN FLCN/SMCR8-type domain-containing protein n=1 Tax=Rhabditophanes sp. KR3021 TaxID=114890 RepID=A0AC35U681_9BILA
MEADLCEKVYNAMETKTNLVTLNMSHVIPLKKIILSSFSYMSGPELQFVWELDGDNECETNSSICYEKEEEYSILNEEEYSGESSNSQITSTTESLEDVGTDSRKDCYEDIDDALADELLAENEDEYNLYEDCCGFKISTQTKSVSMIKSSFSQISQLDDDHDFLCRKEEATESNVSNIDSGIGGTISTHSDLSFLCNNSPPQPNNLLSELMQSGFLTYNDEIDQENIVPTSQMSPLNSPLKSRQSNCNINDTLQVDSDMLTQITTESAHGVIDDDKFIVKIVLAEQICSLQMSNVPIYNKMISVPSRNIFCSSATFQMEQKDSYSMMFAITFVIPLNYKGWLMEKQNMIERFLMSYIPKFKASFMVESITDFLCRLSSDFQNLIYQFCALDKYKFFKRNTFSSIKLSDSYLSLTDLTQSEFQFLARCITGCLISQAKCAIICDKATQANELMLSLAPFVEQRNYHLCIKPHSFPFSAYFYMQSVKRNQLNHVLEESINISGPLCIIDIEKMNVYLTGTYATRKLWQKNYQKASILEIFNEVNLERKPKPNFNFNHLTAVKPCNQVLQLLQHLFILPNTRAPRLHVINQFKLSLQLKASAFIEYVRSVSKPKTSDKKNPIASHWSLIHARKHLSLISDSTFSIIVAEADKQVPHFSEFIFTTAKEFAK